MTIIDIWTRVKQEIQVEKQRYSRTKYGKIVAFFIYCTVFSTIPHLLGFIIPNMTLIMRQEYAYILIMLTTLTLVAILFNCSMIFVYKSKIPFFQQYRINPKKPWPWEENPEQWRKLLIRSIWMTFVSIYIIGGLSLFAQIQIDFSIVMDVNKRLDIQWILLQFFLMMLTQDIIFFSTHFVFHKQPFYKIHKIHHQYTTTISIAGLHFHFIEFMLTQSISTLLCIKAASLVGKFNISTLVIWVIFRMWDAFNGHCGYTFSWSPLQLLPFCTNDQFHDFHHSKNSGNYGSHFRFWDSLFNTNHHFRQYKLNQLNKKTTKSQ